MADRNAQIDKLVNLYRQISQNPSLTGARVIQIARNGINIQSYWSQRNLERGFKQKFTQEFGLDADLNLICESFPIGVSSELFSVHSENEKVKAVLRAVKTDNNTTKQYIEIWDRQHLVKTYDLTAYDIHGDVYSDPQFASMQWSPQNTHLIYVAEKKPHITWEPFYKQKSHYVQREEITNKNLPRRGEQNFYKTTWGEKFVGIYGSVIVILNTEDDSIRTQPFLPEEYFPAQVSWTPDGDYVVGVALQMERRNLGLYACTNRTSYIFLLKNKDFKKLTPEGRYCTSPQFSPDGKEIIWLERERTAPHHNCMRLMRIKWETDEAADVIIDNVKTHIMTANKKKFYGFYGTSIPRKCWSHDSKYILISTPQRSVIKSYLVDMDKKELYEIENKDGNSLSVLEAKRNRVVFTRQSLLKPPQLVVGRIEPDSSNIANLNLINITEPLALPEGADKLMYETNEYVYNTNEAVKEFNFIYFGPKSGEEKTVPLIVMPHGGPNASYCNNFSMECSIYALLGYAMLQINYRGSTGMGSDNVEYLLGKVGETDVLDCIKAIEATLKKYAWLDPTKVILCGGSHGGFLSAHLSAQYASMFRAVVMINPVIDIPAMMSATDIPDWCAAQTGVPFMEKLPPVTKETEYAEILLKMFNHSPILHVDKVKAPTLILLGSEDLRVPPSQGKLWYHRLIANNVETKLLVYKDNHSLSKDESEIDHIINTALWLMEQLDRKPKVEEEIEGVIADVVQPEPESPGQKPPEPKPAEEKPAEKPAETPPAAETQKEASKKS